MMSLFYLFENTRATRKITKDMLDHFQKRTNFHISLVQKYLQKIIELNDSRLDNKILEKEKSIHDQSKFNEPELTPYIYVNWAYHQKDSNKKYDPSDDIKKQMQAATFHHVKTNLHHPEAWDKNATDDSINPNDRDKIPDKSVDAAYMPLVYIATLVADWCAMSEEKKTDPYEWAKNNINKRWQFDKDQEKLIYDLLDKIWQKENSPVKA